jgi:AraC-like DNA-binding protein
MSNAPPADSLTRFPLLHTCDLDESRLVMGALWGKHEVEIKGHIPFETTVNHTEIGQTGLTFVHCPTPLRVRCMLGGDRFTVLLHEEGRSLHQINAESAVGAPGSAVIVVPGQDVRMDSEAVRLLALNFPTTRVEQALRVRGLPRARFEQWARHRDLTSPAGAALRSLARWAAQELDQPASPLSTGPTAEHLEQTLFSLFLDCLAEPFPPAARPDPRLGKIRLSDLDDWILANLQQPLSVDALATLAGVSSRTVQLAFRQYHQCTPMEFIRRARLNGIRQELLTRGEVTTVTEVAMKFGFFHMGHFSDAYRREFGERPAETVRRLHRQRVPGSAHPTD